MQKQQSQYSSHHIYTTHVLVLYLQFIISTPSQHFAHLPTHNNYNAEPPFSPPRPSDLPYSLPQRPITAPTTPTPNPSINITPPPDTLTLPTSPVGAAELLAELSACV